jgi:hypothetical protein
LHYISTGYSGAFEYLDENLTEINFIDGQALTPNSFGTFNSYGVWQPITYGGSYGTNGFYLPFKTNASSYVGSFNGSSQYLTAGTNTNLALGSGDFTMEMWIWFDSMGTQRPMGQGSLGTGEFLLIFYGDGSFDFTDSVTARINGGAGAVTATTWYHLAIVRSGLTLAAYVNGTQKGTTYTPATNYNYNSTNPIYFGAGGAGATGSQTFAGYLDDIRITVGVARYTSNFSVPSTSYGNQ